MLHTKFNYKSYDLQKNSYKYLKIIFLIFVMCIVLTYQVIFSFLNSNMESMEYYKGLEDESVDFRQTCKIPLFHPFKKEVRSYFKNSRPISCRSKLPVLTFIDDDGVLRFNLTAFSESGYTVKTLICHYQEITRLDGKDQDVEFGEKKEMTGHDEVKSDFVYVICKQSSWLPSVYSMYHAFAQRQPNIRQFRDDKELGVAVVGLDSVSRLNFMRQLPHSYRVITKVMNGIVLKGFNKVGHNTFPNIVPILTGNPPDSRPLPTTFDNWPFIWNTLNQDGVATMYGEDLSRIMTFSWWGEGFDKSPTTHYFRPYWIAVDKSSLNAWSSPMCLGPLPKHKLYLDYLKSFLKTYRDSPVFMFSLENEPSHDYLNTVGIMDEHLQEFLVSGLEEGLFNRTVLFVLSDHGQRIDDFRETREGQLEDYMPMVSIIFPKWFSNSHPHLVNILNINSKRLSSSFDLYSTFVDIFQNNFSGADESNTSNESILHFNKASLGMSLLRPLPLNRTCKDAGIPEMYCICLEDTRQLSKDDSLATDSAKILMDHMNQVIQEKSEIWNSSIANYLATNKNASLADFNTKILKKCAKLTKFNIEKSELVTKSDGRMIVRLTLLTKPNSGIYEGRVEWTKTENSVKGKVHEEILRINRYGTQPDCLPRLLMILVPLVRNVCYCV